MDTRDLKLKIFPKDLDANRHVEFNFYASDLVKNVSEALDNATTKTVSAVANIAVTGGEQTLTTLIGVGGELLKTGEKTITTLGNELKTRVLSGKVNTKESNNSSSTWIASIDLPIPNNLEETLQHEWQEENGPVASILNKGLGSDSPAAKIINGISALTGTRNVTVNPDYIQMYKGTKPRSVSFSWSLMPNNKEEAQDIWDIIRRFKGFSSPHPSGSYAFLTAPYFCSITIRNSRMDESLQFWDMIIESVSVNYSESGFMEMYYDGTPKKINLTINFIERRVKTSEDWLTTSESNYYKSQAKNKGQERVTI
jgi:hypothetical protein